MTRKEKREKMDKALKKLVIPELRKRGFRGSFPHFRRKKIEKMNVLGFQFSQWGPQFYLEIASCPIEGITYANGEHREASDIKYSQCQKRKRLSGPLDFEKDEYEKRCGEILNCLDDAEKWWQKN